MRFRSSTATASLSRDRNGDEIATYLVRQGYLQPAEAETIFDHVAVSGNDFGETAVSLGLLKREDLDQATVQRKAGLVLEPGDSRVDPTLVAAFGMDDPYLDHVRAVRSRFLRRAAGSQPGIKTYAFVGFDTREDLSVLAANLAVLMARSELPTLLISSKADYVTPTELFQSGAEANGDNDVVSATAIPNLSLLSVNGADLRGSDNSLRGLARSWPVREGQILASIEYDPRDDGATMASLLRDVDAVILVLRKHVTEFSNVRAIIDGMDAANIPIEGCLIV